MKIKTSVPISNSLQLCLFDDNSLLVRESSGFRTLIGWRGSDYPENTLAQWIDDVGGIYEEAFQTWCKEKAALIRISHVATPPAVKEVPKFTDQERITMLEHAVQKLMDDAKKQSSSQKEQPKHKTPAPDRRTIEEIFGLAHGSCPGHLGCPGKQGLASAAAVGGVFSNPPPQFVDEVPKAAIDEVPGEVNFLVELLTSLGYRVDVFHG